MEASWGYLGDLAWRWGVDVRDWGGVGFIRDRKAIL